MNEKINGEKSLSTISEVTEDYFSLFLNKRCKGYLPVSEIMEKMEVCLKFCIEQYMNEHYDRSLLDQPAEEKVTEADNLTVNSGDMITEKYVLDEVINNEEIEMTALIITVVISIIVIIILSVFLIKRNKPKNVDKVEDIDTSVEVSNIKTEKRNEKRQRKFSNNQIEERNERRQRKFSNNQTKEIKGRRQKNFSNNKIEEKKKEDRDKILLPKLKQNQSRSPQTNDISAKLEKLKSSQSNIDRQDYSDYINADDDEVVKFFIFQFEKKIFDFRFTMRDNILNWKNIEENMEMVIQVARRQIQLK